MSCSYEIIDVKLNSKMLLNCLNSAYKFGDGIILCHVSRKPALDVCKQQRRRQDFTFVLSGQHLFKTTLE